MTECFVSVVSAKIVLYKYSSFPFLFLLAIHMQPMDWDAQLAAIFLHIHAHFFRQAMLTRKVGHTDVLFLSDLGSLVDLHMQDYKLVTICTTLVNIQTQRQTTFDQLI